MVYTIKFYNNLTKTEKSYEATDQEDSLLYFHFKDLVIDLPDGEYTYKVYSDNTLITSGLARVGNVETKRNNTEYNGTKQYKQYNG